MTTIPKDRRQNVQGTVYLICFETNYRHAKHYMGWTTDLDSRLQAHHTAGRGARLMEVITAAGIGFTLTRPWQGTRYLERRLKNRGGHARLRAITHLGGIRQVR